MASTLFPHYFFMLALAHQAFAVDAGLSAGIQCYSLPYGLLGFISHLLTFWAIFWLVQGRSSILRKATFTRFGLFIAAISTLVGAALTIVTMVRCRNHTDLLLVSIWKFGLSVTTGCISTHVAYSIVSNDAGGRSGLSNNHNDRSGYRRLHDSSADARTHRGPQPRIDVHRSGLTSMSRNNHHRQRPARYNNPTHSRQPSIEEHKSRPTPESNRSNEYTSFKRILWWFGIYFPCAIAGLTGLFRIVVASWSTNRPVRIVSIVFGLTFLIFGSFTYILVLIRADGKPAPVREALYFKSILFASFVTMLCAAFYSDWVLGTVSGNITGVPSSDNAALFWLYFVFKRLSTITI